MKILVSFNVLEGLIKIKKDIEDLVELSFVQGMKCAAKKGRRKTLRTTNKVSKPQK